jgi:hypothetical protein
VTQLPAAIPSAASAAIAAVTIPATASAASATTTAASASATTAAEAASATTATGSPSAATTAAFSRRPGFIDHNVAAHEIFAVQSLDGALCFLIAIDLDKTKTAWLPRKTVAHQGYSGRGDSRLRK